MAPAGTGGGMEQSMRKFDLAVIGTGTAAATAALACSESGFKVAVMDSRPFGGTCMLRGCEPKKILVEAADAVDKLRRMKGKGIAGSSAIEWRELMRFKRSLIDPASEQRESRFSRAGIAGYHGRARLTGRNNLEVDGEALEADHILIAAGAKPAQLNLPGEDLLATSEDFLNLDTLPGKIVFLGGGYISFEFAHVAARAGADVTIVHRGSRPLAGFDPELVGMLVKRSESLGVRVLTDTEVKRIERTETGYQVHATRQSGGEEQLLFPADLVVHGGGRAPDLDGLGLDAAGVEWDLRKGVHVNQYLQSVSNPNVYAAGDAIRNGGLPLTPVAEYDGKIVAANLLHGNREAPDYRGIPTVAFTVPPIASVGLHEAAARQQGLHFRKNFGDASSWYSARRVAEPCSGYKVLVEDGSEKILGAHLIGPRADDLINVFAMAIRLGLTTTDLRKPVFVFPTRFSDLESML